jgi:hypothetical protein
MSPRSKPAVSFAVPQSEVSLRLRRLFAAVASAGLAMLAACGGAESAGRAPAAAPARNRIGASAATPAPHLRR